MADYTEKQDAFLSCIYDARQGKLTEELQQAGQDELVAQLGSHWSFYSFSHMVSEGFIQPGSPVATMSERGAKLLLLATGSGPLPDATHMQANFDLVEQVQRTLGVDPTSFHAKFRVLPTADPQQDSPVAVQHTCLGHPRDSEIRELAEAGVALLALGGYAVAFYPKQGLSTTELYVYARPGKPPRTDITVDKAFRVLKGLEKL